MAINTQNQQNRGGGYRGGAHHGRGGQHPSGSSAQTVSEYFEKVVQVNRVSKKTKGGDKRSISVIVVVGDRKGKVGVGLGKAADVQSAVAKATNYAKRHLIIVPMRGRTIPHHVFVKNGAARVMLKPAPNGTGVIAGGAVRVVVEAAGIHDIVSKSLGTKNQASNVYATLEALKKLKVVKADELHRSKANETSLGDGSPAKKAKKKGEEK